MSTELYKKSPPEFPLNLEVAANNFVVGNPFGKAEVKTPAEALESLDSGRSGDVAVAADELVIPITHHHVSKTTGGDGEALTLADGSPGQILTITLVTDGGGDGTLTPATVTGFATIVFADAGDIATLKFIDTTVGWVLLGTAGVAAPPVITV